ncbi:penicillin-binding protein 2 [Granulicella sp. 5B5]|uniref:penicillin-binding protein 2 n=1 Tax=Granulicella sp. 5B5 TaxID=1617967 RepID=UPI0015F47787|nr:penicillin-binding protein 2 [Granulicella sp. 5B5]QMV19453.1 penicillin-binding protein 2 [Granulicella sp. 5B5]
MATPEDLESIARQEKLSTVKLHASQYIVALVLFILGAGLWRLQILGANSYRVLAEQNRIRKVPVLAPRGRIFDREGRIIVDNYPSVSCYLLREQQKSLDADLPLISAGLHIPIEQIQATIRHYQYAPKYQPIPLKQDITPDEQAFIEAHRSELPELETLEEQRRLYPRDGFMAHLIGYVGEVSENDLNQSRFAFYAPGDVVGKSGIEEAYDEILRGTDGSRDVIVNSHGKELGVMGQELATPGKDIRLTIDLDVQMAAEKALEGKTGAIVAMDPHTGEILAMASRPTFDPNEFAVRLSSAYWQTIRDNPDHPMMNKAIQAQLAPGSTFKIIMTLAGLQEGVAQNMHVNCAGGGTFYGHFFACDRHHGAVDIHNAIPYSCDTFYYTLAEKLGIDTIAKYGSEVGIGEKTGIDLPDEAEGVMPSERWKLKTLHDKWYAGETISVGIGQGALEVTPLQLARALGGIASGGHLVRPHVVFPDELTPDELSAIRSTYLGSGDKTIPLTPANWQIITDDMAAVTGPTGTAASAHLDGIDFAGKTGTAQIMSHDALARTNKGHNTEPNAWFVGMAPRRNPDIVVAVLWEHGVWGQYSARLAAQVIDAYVNKQRARAGNVMKLASNTPAATDDTPAGTGASVPYTPQPADDRKATTSPGGGR